MIRLNCTNCLIYESPKSTELTFTYGTELRLLLATGPRERKDGGRPFIDSRKANLIGMSL